MYFQHNIMMSFVEHAMTRNHKLMCSGSVFNSIDIHFSALTHMYIYGITLFVGSINVPPPKPTLSLSQTHKDTLSHTIPKSHVGMRHGSMELTLDLSRKRKTGIFSRTGGRPCVCDQL